MSLFGKENNNQKVTINASGYKDGTLYRVCPKCGRELPLREFGERKMGNGEVRNQSWCKQCR